VGTATQGKNNGLNVYLGSAHPKKFFEIALCKLCLNTDALIIYKCYRSSRWVIISRSSFNLYIFAVNSS